MFYLFEFLLILTSDRHRTKHACLLSTAFRWNIRALVKASMIPAIGHYDVHLRDRLSDIARGTPLEKV